MPRITPGTWPTMVTPFKSTESGRTEVDWDGVTALVEWYIQQRVAGIFTVCLSSEMYNLSPEERLCLAKHVVDQANGRVPVVASGTFADDDTIEKKGTFVKRMYRESGVDAVVVIASQMCGEDGDGKAWQQATQRLLDATIFEDGTSVPLGLYECPVPYHRLLSLEDMKWVFASGRFSFLKDTCCRLGQIEERLALRPAEQRDSFMYFNANAATLFGSLKAGADGFSGIAGNVYPLVHTLLREAVQQRREEDCGKLQRFLTVCERLVCHKYPASAKRFLQLNYGIPIDYVCRTATFGAWDEEEDIGLRDLHAMMQIDLLPRLDV